MAARLDGGLTAGLRHRSGRHVPPLDSFATSGWRTRVGAGLDGLILRGASAVIDRTIMPPPERAGDLRESGAFYRSDGLVQEPRRFFGFLDEGLEAPWVRTSTLRSRWPGAERVAIRFHSRYAPFNPRHQATYADQVENHTVRVELYRHAEGRARGTVIALHGFGTGYPRIDAPTLLARDLFAMGLDVALPTLPLHGPRTPRGARFSGQAFAVPDVTQLNEAMGQAVHDLASFIAWLRERSARPVGMIGLSLGGYMSALMASLIDDLDFVVPMAAPVCFGHLAHRFMARSSRYRDDPSAALGLDELRSAFRVHSPLSHRRRLSGDRILIIAGAGDRIVPPEHPTWLWEHWQRPRMHWFSGSHLAPFGRRGVLDELRSFLRHLGVA